MEETKFDLSTLDLSEGTHEITVKARAEGYADSDESNMVYYTVLVQGGGGNSGGGELSTPEITLDGDTLTMTARDGTTQAFAIFVNGIEKTTVENTKGQATFTVSTLGLAPGEYEITVKARALGYTDSPASEPVNYLVISEEPDEEPDEEFDDVLYPDDSNDTDMNNENNTEVDISGAWYFVKYPSIDWLKRVVKQVHLGATVFQVYTNTSEDIKNIDDWVRTDLVFTEDGILMNGMIVCGENGFEGYAYRYIIFDVGQNIPYNLSNWLQGNAIPVESPVNLV